MTYHNLDIPPFLRRKKSENVVSNIPKPTSQTIAHEPNSKKQALTAALKDRLAREIIAAVRQGHDTFGKLRKALGHDDRLLKAGLRHAKSWQQDLHRTGGRQKPRHSMRQNRLDVDGRRYRVISTS